MKTPKVFLLTCFLFITAVCFAQITTASLQAGGLTCSMCSKAVKSALEGVPFVRNVQVDIKNQRYNLAFKSGSTVDLDALAKAVQDAGFSVAALTATANFSNVRLEKDKHLNFGGQTFHFLNADGQTLNGSVNFTVVDKGFVSPKAFKKYAALSKLACVQTGRMAACCVKEDILANDRVFHVII